MWKKSTLFLFCLISYTSRPKSNVLSNDFNAFQAKFKDGFVEKINSGQKKTSLTWIRQCNNTFEIKDLFYWSFLYWRILICSWWAAIHMKTKWQQKYIKCIKIRQTRQKQNSGISWLFLVWNLQEEKQNVSVSCNFWKCKVRKYDVNIVFFVNKNNVYASGNLICYKVVCPNWYF